MKRLVTLILLIAMISVIFMGCKQTAADKFEKENGIKLTAAEKEAINEVANSNKDSNKNSNKTSGSKMKKDNSVNKAGMQFNIRPDGYNWEGSWVYYITNLQRGIKKFDASKGLLTPDQISNGAETITVVADDNTRKITHLNVVKGIVYFISYDALYSVSNNEVSKLADGLVRFLLVVEDTIYYVGRSKNTKNYALHAMDIESGNTTVIYEDSPVRFEHINFQNGKLFFLHGYNPQQGISMYNLKEKKVTQLCLLNKDFAYILQLIPEEDGFFYQGTSKPGDVIPPLAKVDYKTFERKPVEFPKGDNSSTLYNNNFYYVSNTDNRLYSIDLNYKITKITEDQGVNIFYMVKDKIVYRYKNVTDSEMKWNIVDIPK